MLFFKKKPAKSKPELPPYSKKVQFVYLPPEELTALLEQDLNLIPTLEPVNYYAEKSKYYQFVFYYTEDYSRIVLQPELYENDRKTKSFKLYDIDKALYAKILRRFGQVVNFQ